MTPCAFYSVADERFFIGVTALLNSIRLAGHDEPFFLTDAGLTPDQRRLLADHVELVPAPGGTPTVFLGPLGPVENPAAVQVVLDADVIVTSRLDALIAEANENRLVTFVNNEPNHERFFPEWGEVLGLSALNQAPYVNAGQILLSQSLNSSVLVPMIEGLRKVSVKRTWYENGTLDDPFYFGDQDVLNALAMGSLAPTQVVRLDHRLAPHPPFDGLSILDVDTITCAYPDGVQPYFLHHTLAKPWLRATRNTVYSKLLPRLLMSSDVAVRLQPDQLPLRLREGWAAATDRRRADLQALVYTSARAQIGRMQLRTRFRSMRAHLRGSEPSEAPR